MTDRIQGLLGRVFNENYTFTLNDMSITALISANSEIKERSFIIREEYSKLIKADEYSLLAGEYTNVWLLEPKIAHDSENEVKLLLENYGFAVTDLGKDVPPETIAAEVVKQHAPLVGLSALMTTTVPAMEKTIALLRREAPWCKIIVGGAVLNKEYADKIGADKYAKDAMETVRYAEEINQQFLTVS